MRYRGNKMQVNILGTKYQILRQTQNENQKLKDMCGYCDFSSKKIVVDTFEEEKQDVNAQDNVDVFANKVLRHEIIHAFLGESGLRSNSDWSENEEMVDWFAIQFPKILKVFEELNIKE